MKKLFPILSILIFSVLLFGCSGQGNLPESTNSAELEITATPTEKVVPTNTVQPTSLPIATPAPIEIGGIEGYELVWNDEFNGDSINRENWDFHVGGWGFGNGEAQYYTDRPENARVENGLLVIEGRFERYEHTYYTSAKLWTYNLFEFQYGYVEARAKVPEGAGLWPAFWMLGADYEESFDANGNWKNNWPFTGEIDIVEYLGREPRLVLGTAHGPGYAGALGLGKWNPQEFDIADDWHTYAIEWEEDSITWLFDGEPYYTLTSDIVGENREWVFNKEFFMILNLALGGSFGGTIGLDTQFPANYYIDYVRVYQKAP